MTTLTQAQIDHLDGKGQPSPFASKARELAIGTFLNAVETRVETLEEPATRTNPEASTAITGATETAAAFDKSATIPAGTLEVGDLIRVKAMGLHTAATAAETHTIGLNIGGVSMGVTGNLTPGAANHLFVLEWEGVVRSDGDSGTIVGVGTVAHGLRAAAATATHLIGTGATSTSTAAIDTTADLDVEVVIDRQAAATDSDSARLDFLSVQVVKPAAA